MGRRESKLPDVTAEFEDVRLPDARLAKRLMAIVEKASADPSASFPRMTGTDEELEGLYRFLGNARVEFDALLEPHFELTCERAQAAERIIAIHDTSTFILEGSRGAELGFVNTGARGFFLHSSVAVRAGGSRECLGSLAARTLFRETLRAKGSRLSGAQCAELESKESNRWFEQIEEVEKRLRKRSEVVHVADSEADSYALMAQMVRSQFRFVTRLARDRVARVDEDSPWLRVSEIVGEAADVVEREVPLPRRAEKGPPRTKKKFPPREARSAKLRFAVMPMQLKRPGYVDKTHSPTLTVNAVHVYEVDAPDGVEPVEWCLLTNEPATTRDEALAIVDIYRTRWVIEDFFRAVKTGCSYEERQLEGRHAWLSALAITLPLAWRLLQLRQLARVEPDSPATRVFSATELEVLRHLRPKALVSARPTLREAMLALASLGGHIKNNGDPGWLVLHRGLSELEPFARGVEYGRLTAREM